MAIKIDLEKAYDHMSWEFLKKVLEEIKLPKDKSLDFSVTAQIVAVGRYRLDG